MSIEQLYNATVDVIRITKVADGLGGQTETETTLHSNLLCRINWTKGDERAMFGKTTVQVDAKLYCSVVDITPRDRIIYNGVYYNLVKVSDVDNMGRFLTIEMEKREPQ